MKNRQTTRPTDRRTGKSNSIVMQKIRETDRQTDGQTERQTDSQTDRQADRQTDRQTNKQTIHLQVPMGDAPTSTNVTNRKATSAPSGVSTRTVPSGASVRPAIPWTRTESTASTWTSVRRRRTIVRTPVRTWSDLSCAFARKDIGRSSARTNART